MVEPWQKVSSRSLGDFRIFRLRADEKISPRTRQPYEFIVIDSGEGYLLNGPDLGSVTLTPFRGPCVIVMPAGAFHRIVRTDDQTTDSILIYTDRRSVVPRYEHVMARTTVIAVAGAAPERVEGVAR